MATIRGFYVQHTPALSITRRSSNLLAYQKQSEIINRILLSTSTEISYTIEEPERLLKAVREYNLFFIDGLEAFQYAQYTYLIYSPEVKLKTFLISGEFSINYL